jgi:hypothetical protein
MTKHDYQIDPAALAAASLAAILALSTKEGEYDSLAFVTSATLVLLLIAYSGESNRSTLQSIAFSAVLALCSTEGIGFLLVKAVHFGIRAAQKSNPSETSVVIANDVRLSSFVLGCCWFIDDRYKYRKHYGSFFGPAKFNETAESNSDVSGTGRVEDATPPVRTQNTSD